MPTLGKIHLFKANQIKIINRTVKNDLIMYPRNFNKISPAPSLQKKLFTAEHAKSAEKKIYSICYLCVLRDLCGKILLFMKSSRLRLQLI